ncbi:MAG: helix-turn-helix transcriptional regulator [Candidatus Schekmanbacteria bacterium]|nr:helix-turn-helix transcriptional regulator [Candidatus Schekmanbacteria bacterium]
MSYFDDAPDRNSELLRGAADLLAALAHPLRLRIVDGLLRGDCCVTNMVDCLGLPQPIVSRHLAILRNAGVLAVTRAGRKRSYRVVHPLAARVVPLLLNGSEQNVDRELLPVTLGASHS